MAKGNNEAKIKFTAETQDFTKAVADANRSLGTLGAELKLNATEMKGMSDTTDKLAERKKLLSDQLGVAESKTEALRQKMAAAERIYGENSEEVERLKKQVALAATAEEKIRQEIDKVNTELKQQAAESNKTESALDKLEKTISDQESAMDDLKRAYSDAVLTYGKNSKEAKTLASEMRNLGSELSDNRTKMQNVESAADRLSSATDDAGDAAENANDGFTIWKGTLADLASSAIQGALSGISNLASTFWNLDEETRELRTNMGKIETAFETAGLSAGSASETYEDFYGIVADEGQATEAVSHLAKLTDSQKELDEWTQICTGVYATFGDSLPIENLTEAANETAKTGTVTGGLADALNWSTMSSEEWGEAFKGHPKALKKFQSALKSGLTTEEAFNEALTQCTTESEREQVIRQALTGLYGEAAAAYAETNGEIMEANKAQANYNTALAGLGEIIEPIKTAFTNGMASMLESVTALFEGMDTEAIKGMIEDAFTYINDTVFPAIKTGIQWFIDNKDLVIGGITGIVAGIAAFKVVTIVQTAIGLFKSFQAATQGLTIAQKLLNLVMKMNPIGIIISLVVGLVAAFIYLWNNCDAFREFWLGLWDSIKATAGIVVDALIEFFTVTVPEAWNSFLTFVSTLWSNIWTTISTWASNIWSSVTTWFTNTKNDAVTAISNLWSEVTTWFSNLWSDLSTWAMNIWTSVTTWFSNIKNSVVSTVSGLWSSVTTWFSNLWSSLSSTAANIWTSVTTWFNNTKNSVVSTASGIWSSVTTWFSNLWSSLTSTVSGIWSTVTTWFNNTKENVVKTASNLWTSVTSKFSSLWSSAKTIWGNIKSAIGDAIGGARDKVYSVASNIWEKITTVFYSVKSTVTSVWNSIKSAIEDPINKAKETVETVVGKIKSAFDFDWSLPKIKLPHFSVSGGKAPWGFMGEGSLPSVSVKWYAKGAILEAPTLFGVGKDGNLMGGGEAGAEAVAPIDVLLGYVREAVLDVFELMTNSNGVNAALSNVEKLEGYLSANNNGDLSRLIDAVEDLASRAINIDIDGMRIATATAGANDSVSGNRLNLKTRGLALR